MSRTPRHCERLRVCRWHAHAAAWLATQDRRDIAARPLSAHVRYCRAHPMSDPGLRAFFGWLRSQGVRIDAAAYGYEEGEGALVSTDIHAIPPHWN